MTTETLDQERRKARRFNEKLDVIIDDPESIQHTHLENLSESGFFINTLYTIRETSGIRFRLILPNSNATHEINIKGQVVFSLDQERASRIGTEPGIGIKVLSFPSQEEENKYLQFLNQLAVI